MQILDQSADVNIGSFLPAYVCRQCECLQTETPSSIKIEMPSHKRFIQGYGKKDPPSLGLIHCK